MLNCTELGESFIICSENTAEELMVHQFLPDMVANTFGNTPYITSLKTEGGHRVERTQINELFTVAGRSGLWRRKRTS
jgi:hypothetical protein